MIDAMCNHIHYMMNNNKMFCTKEVKVYFSLHNVLCIIEYIHITLISWVNPGISWESRDSRGFPAFEPEYLIWYLK